MHVTYFFVAKSLQHLFLTTKVSYISELNLCSISFVTTKSLQHLFLTTKVVRILVMDSTIFNHILLCLSVFTALTCENTRSTRALETGVLKHAKAYVIKSLYGQKPVVS